jgi:hypothetical protein
MSTNYKEGAWGFGVTAVPTASLARMAGISHSSAIN